MIKRKFNLTHCFIIGLLCINNTIISKASGETGFTVEPINIEGTEDNFYDSEVPAALRITKINNGGSSYDGLKVGDILYRNSYLDVDYYSPVVPDALIGRVNKAEHQNWGPWNMDSNTKDRQILSKHTYSSAKMKESADVYTDDGTGKLNASVVVGSLNKDATFTPLGIGTYLGVEYVYLDLYEFSHLNGKKGKTNVGRVPASKVQLSGYISTVFDNHNSSNLLLNFKPVGKYSDNMRTHHKNLSTGRFTNPDASYVNSYVRGKKGEWRYLGYNALGQPLDNPYFPGDSISFFGASNFTGYPLRLTPWNVNDAESDEWTPDTAYNKFKISGVTAYDTDGKYSTLKSNVMKRLYENGYITSDLDYYKNRLSLRTHPTKQPTIIMGQRKYETYYRVGFLPLETMLRDIYIRTIKVTDIMSNKVIATTTCDINGNCSYGSGTVYRDKLYRVEIVLANGANSHMLKKTLEAQVGYRFNDSSPKENISFNQLSNTDIVRRGNYGGMAGQIHALSNPFHDSISISSTQSGTIDVYGFVGGSHAGVDNTKYHNDIAYLRLTVSTTPPPPGDDDGGGSSCEISSGGTVMICGGGDLKATSISLIDEQNNEVYKISYGSTNPSVKKALIPGTKYKISYTATYSGESVKEYVWSEPIDDDVTTEDIDEYNPGGWVYSGTKSYKIPLNYMINKYSDGTSQTDSKVSNAQYNFKVKLSNGSLTDTITLDNNMNLNFTTDYIMFQHPYLNTAFRIVTNDSRINSSTSNDRLETTINDTFDISLDKLTVTPSVTYIDGPSNIKYSVSYDVNLNTPSYVTAKDYQTSINTAIKINGKTFYVSDQLVKGTDGNKNITHQLEGINISNEGNLNVSVVLNYDKLSYESGNYDNNDGSTNVSVIKVMNPNSGKPNDKVGTPDSLNSNNPNKGGDGNDNCLYPRTKNTWTSTHRKLTWNSNLIQYQKLNDNSNVSFRDYYSTYENLNEATETYQETFGIKKILFRSKDTKDKRYGDNGWVDLLDSTEQKQAIIKAGYGFELKVVTNYNTNAFTKRTWNHSSSNTSGTSISSLNGDINYGLQDIFLELPGTTSTRKILSSTGYSDTIVGLNAVKNIDDSTGNAEWTYTIKPTNTLGVGSEPKIYIPYETKDGEYTLKIYTPPISGASSVNKKKYSALCDRKEVKFTVKGSAMNDLNSHETQ